mmetsp:Transcript_47550/g.77090  ORF Transcript_47550/g.77090 Transcript_47550/m.77090 type:complete len:239 (-) Transcript_47550:120-836(-)
MVDRRSGLAQELTGTYVALPCARLRPKHPPRDSDWLPPAAKKIQVPEEKGEYLFGGTADLRQEMQAYSGTKGMSFHVARSRSMSCLAAGGPLDRVLKLRHETDLDRLIEVLVRAAPDQRKDGLRQFRQPFNPHREAAASKYITDDQRRQQVLQVLRKYPLCDIYDLARCDQVQWANISREMGGLGYGTAMKSAMQAVGQALTPLERASFWAAVGNRQRVVDHGRSCGIAARDSLNEYY